MHELRKEPLLSRWVAVLEDSKGPDAYEVLRRRSESSGCGLCSATLGAEGVKTVKSPVPVLGTEGSLGRRGIGMYDRMNGYGVHEVIIESPGHDKPPEDLGPSHMQKVIEAQVGRIKEIEKDEKIKYVLVSKNSGMLAGAVNSHPHCQIIATPVIPMRIKAELDGAKDYYAYKERCIFCDFIDEESRAGERVITLSERFIAFCPYASRFPFEFWVMPRRHNCSFKDMGPEEAGDLGEVMASALRKMRKALREPSYSYVIHTAPNLIPRKDLWHTLGEDFHWHIEVVPRLLRASGFEWGSGFYVNTTSPEDAARYYREA